MLQFETLEEVDTRPPSSSGVLSINKAFMGKVHYEKFNHDET
jgi:hypothetical protein